MAGIEDAIVDGVVEELDAGEAPTAQPGMNTIHGGPGTSSMNYAPGTSTSGGGVAGLHETKGTRPLAGDFVSPTCPPEDAATEDAATEQARADAFAAVVAQVKIDRAIADASLRRFHRDPVASTGYVPGLELLEKRTKS